MLKLEEIIDAAEGREIKRAIAVKMILLGFKTKDICDLLEVSDAFVSKWKIIYENEGAGGLRLHYKGGPKFLTDAQRREICFHLRDKPHYSVEELRDLTPMATLALLALMDAKIRCLDMPRSINTGTNPKENNANIKT